MNWLSNIWSADENAEDGAAGGTTDTRYRWKYLSSLVAGGYALGWPAAIVGGYVDPASFTGGTWATLMSGWFLVMVYCVGLDVYHGLRSSPDEGASGEAGDDDGTPENVARTDAGPVAMRRALAEEREDLAKRYSQQIRDLEEQVEVLETKIAVLKQESSA